MSTRIHTHRWYPPDDTPTRPRGVYVVHGLGEHGARYARLATRLAQSGWPVASHDHPGHGRSDGARGRHDPPGALAIQIAIQVAAFAAETGQMPYLFGHSLGGAIAAELVLVHRLPVAGLLLSAPAIVPRIGRRDRVKLRLMSLIAPTLTLQLPYDPERLTHDEHEIESAHADAFIHGYKSAELVNALLDTGRRVIDAAPTLEVDLLLLIAGDDHLIDTDMTRDFASRLPSERLTVKVYDDARHELLNETPDRRERVMEDIVGWLDARDRSTA